MFVSLRGQPHYRVAQACKRQLSISGVGSLPQLPTGFVPLRVRRLELVAKDGPGNAAEATASFCTKRGRFAASGGQGSHPDALWVVAGSGPWVGLTGQFAWKLGARLAVLPEACPRCTRRTSQTPVWTGSAGGTRAVLWASLVLACGGRSQGCCLTSLARGLLGLFHRSWSGAD